MAAIVIVSCYHLWLGLCLLLLPVMPHPFGQIEPFYRNGEGLSYAWTGVMFLTVSMLAIIALMLGRTWYIHDSRIRFIRRVALTAPQQIVITYTAYQGVMDAFDAISQYGLHSDYTSRLILALNVSMVFAVLHMYGSIQWWASAPRWKSKKCLNPPCPFRIAEQTRQRNG
jgi:hypothetical protein